MADKGSPLDEDVVAPGSRAVHADLDLAGGQHLDEVSRGELAALIGIEDLGRAVLRQRLFDSFDAEVGFQRDRYPPCEDPPGEPVQHGGEVDGEPCCAIGPSDNGERAPWAYR